MLWHAIQGAGGFGGDRSWDIDYASFDWDGAGWWEYRPGTPRDPNNLFFKSDGTKMYIPDAVDDEIYEYTLSTAWDVTTATFVQFLDVITKSESPQDVFFKTDGTKMYIVNARYDTVDEYDLSTAWDISTASWLQGFSISTEETNPKSLFFKDDGTKMYVIGTSGDDVNEYTLSTAWDISTASYSQVFSVAGQEATPTSLFFGSSGTKMYVCGSGGDDVNEYTLSTAWDVSTATYVQNKSVRDVVEAPSGMSFSSDGTKAYIASGIKDAVYQYTLSTAWDVSTMTWNKPNSNYFTSSEDGQTRGLFFKSDGTKMYIIGWTGDDFNEYNLSTAWDVSTATYSQVKFVSGVDNEPLGIFFKPDGTKAYMVGSQNDRVNEYDLSTAWDVSTLTFNQNFSVSTYSTNPEDVFFKDDGTKMYTVSATTDNVTEWSLSTAWDVSTTSYVQDFSVNAQETSPAGLFFKDDGTRMYVSGLSGDDINQYTLSTAWDVSTASYDTNFNVSSQTGSPQSVFFKPDGSGFYVLTGDNTVWEFDIG